VKIPEFETKRIFSKYGIKTPRGNVATTPEQAEKIASELGRPVMIKAQIPISGRAKLGAILPANTPSEAKAIAAKLLGKEIAGMRVKEILVEEKLDIQHEYYLGITIDRTARTYVAIFSPIGGTDIEEIAETHPEKIIKVHINPFIGLLPFMAKKLVRSAGLRGNDLRALPDVMIRLWKIVQDYDAELVEINPLVECDGQYVAVDARMIIDDNALFRHPEFQKFTTSEVLSEREEKARELGIPYVELDGQIAIMANGAGLAMATMDLLHLYGEKPACFLDLGGGVSSERVRQALSVVLSNPRVRVVAINILGGITSCKEVAIGISDALRKLNPKIPILIRLKGTDEEEGRKILEESGVNVILKDTMEDLIKSAISIYRGMRDDPCKRKHKSNSPRHYG